MANKSIRIKTNTGGTDKYVTVRLENNVDFYEILSLKISQKDIYATFNSDYGVIVGRVIANGGIGIPNAKISVFIPISDEDKANSDIYAVYPYSSPRDKDLDNVRYNLLPRVSINNPFLTLGEYAPLVPIGTFPTKEEITTNNTFLQVYEKYYKFTTVTNQSGDYMIFGVPIGIQTVHMSVDITDIGKYSMTPGTMIKILGYSPNLFSEGGTKVKYSTDLDTLPNVETQEIAVDVKPFWGDETNYEIGITRQDFKIRATLISTFTVFGSAFTDGINSSWGHGSYNSSSSSLNRMTDDANIGISISSKRNGLIHEQIGYLPSTISNADVLAGNFDPINDYKTLDSSQYNSYIDNGVFIYQIICNRNKVITNEEGAEVLIDDNDPRGVYTEFTGFFVFQYGGNDQNSIELPINDNAGDFNGKSPNLKRMRLKFPQYGGYGTVHTLAGNEAGKSWDSSDINPYTIAWKKQTFTFSASTFYSVAKYNGIRYVPNNNANNAGSYDDLTGDPFQSAAMISVDNGNSTLNSSFEYPTNHNHYFGAQWMNFSIYFPQIVHYDTASPKVSFLLTQSDQDLNLLNDNKQVIGGKITNTIYMGRSDLHLTTFITVPKEDILNIINHTLDGSSSQGFRNILDEPYTHLNKLIGTDYKTTTNGANVDGINYFYKGLSSTGSIATNGNADIFLFLRNKNII